MRAGARGGQPLAPGAVESGLEPQRADPQLGPVEAVEDGLRVVGAVVAADPGVVAAHDQPGDAVVLAGQGVEQRLARSGVAHGRREGRQQRALLRVVALDQRLVGLEAHRGRHVVALGLAHQRMDHEPVADLEGQLGQVLVGAMDRVAGLEAGHAAPAALLQLGPQGPRREAPLGEGQVVGQRQHGHRSADQRARALQQVRHAGVGRVLGAVDLAGLPQRVALVDLGHVQQAPQPALLVVERGPAARLEQRRGLRRDRQCEGQRPERAVGQPQALQHALVVGAAQEAGQRAGGPGGDELQVGALARVEAQARQRAGHLAQRRGLVVGDDAVDQDAPVGAGQALGAHGSLLVPGK